MWWRMKYLLGLNVVSNLIVIPICLNSDIFITHESIEFPLFKLPIYLRQLTKLIFLLL